MVKRNRELLIAYNIAKNGSLWSDVVFEKEVISHSNIWIEFETSAEVSNSSILKEHTTCVTLGVFSSIILSQLRRPIEFKLTHVYYFMHLLRCEKTCLWQYQRCPVHFKYYYGYEPKLKNTRKNISLSSRDPKNNTSEWHFNSIHMVQLKNAAQGSFNQIKVGIIMSKDDFATSSLSKCDSCLINNCGWPMSCLHHLWILIISRVLYAAHLFPFPHQFAWINLNWETKTFMLLRCAHTNGK